MRKFKHKVKDITLVKCKNGNSYSSQNWEGYYIPSEFVENSSDWKEIVEKNYEILSFKNELNEIFTLQSDGAYKQSTDDIDHHWRTLKFMLETAKKCAINSVKRLSDGEVFTLGDTIANMCNSEQKIKELYIDKNDGKMCVYTSTTCRFTIHSIKKVSHPILTTEDGVEIYGSEALHIVSKCFSLGIGLNFTKDDYKDSSYLFFAEKENAERYIELNSPKYSIKDIIPIVNNWSMCGIDEDNILNFLAKNENNNV